MKSIVRFLLLIRLGLWFDPELVVLSDSVSIYRGDCRDILPTLGKVDAVVTDPPYGITHPCNFAGRGRGNLAACNDWPDVAGDAEPFDPAWILDMNKPTVLWGGNWFADKLPPTSGWLVWDKERPDELDQATCELAWTNCIKGVRRFRHLWNGMMKASEKGESFHPTQKPVALFAWTLALRWLADVETVFDPYMGSGPCGVACVRAGKRYVGCEINPAHFATARARLENELRQGLLPLKHNTTPQRMARPSAGATYAEGDGSGLLESKGKQE